MAEIPLTKGKIALVDDEDLQRCNDYGPWFIHGNYAATQVGSKVVRLHKFILKTEEQVDHENNDPLDCRKQNLRLATQTQNNQNRRTNYNKRFKGVSAARDKWRAYIQVNGKLLHLGVFLLDSEAAQAYNEAATKHFGEFAKLNQL